MFLFKSLSPKERVQGAPLLGDSRFEKEHRAFGVEYPK
jgi:hypothetical protein